MNDELMNDELPGIEHDHPGAYARGTPRGVRAAALAAAALCIAHAAFAEPRHADVVAPYSRIITETERQFTGFFDAVDLHIVDPSLYLKERADSYPPALDMSGLDQRLRSRIAGQLPLLAAMRITREIPAAIIQGETATGIYVLPSGRTLCVIAGGNTEMTIESALARYSGLEAPAVPEWIRFDEGDLLRFLLYHEVAHCSVKGPPNGRRWTAYDVHVAENLSDAFAVLMHLRRTQDETLPHLFATMRESALARLADREHMTVRSIEAALEWGTVRCKDGRLSSMDARGVFEQARAIARESAYTAEEFAALGSDASRHLHSGRLAARGVQHEGGPAAP